MIFLSEDEKTQWKELSEEIISSQITPEKFSHSSEIRSNLLPVFEFYVSSLAAALNFSDLAIKWVAAGAHHEEQGLSANSCFLDFLERHKGGLVMPAIPFADPRPYQHFESIPVIRKAREAYASHVSHSLPDFPRPASFIDIGCGDGSMTLLIMKELLESGKVESFDDIQLIDKSSAMLKKAKGAISAAFPDVKVFTSTSRIEKVSDHIDNKFDIAICGLAYHHLPYETKKMHLEIMRDFFDHFIIFEIDANNDTPALYSPELALSVYQSYGRLMHFVSSHEAPAEVINSCLDCFLMSEEISFFTEPRGNRTDYHMLRSQWRTLFEETLVGDGFSCLSDSVCYGDEYMCLFTMHYGR